MSRTFPWKNIFMYIQSGRSWNWISQNSCFCRDSQTRETMAPALSPLPAATCIWETKKGHEPKALRPWKINCRLRADAHMVSTTNVSLWIGYWLVLQRLKTNPETSPAASRPVPARHPTSVCLMLRNRKS